MKLLVDEMWDDALVQQLRLRGHDVVSVRERKELRGKGDSIVFAAAQAEHRAVLTENSSDFRVLARRALAAGRSHWGLILTSNRHLPRHRPGTLGRVVLALDALLQAGSDLTNQEIWLL